LKIFKADFQQLASLIAMSFSIDVHFRSYAIITRGTELEFNEVIRYYSKPIVRREIVEYSKNRWIALHTSSGLFLRYWSRIGPPLRISSEQDIDKLLQRFRGLEPRTFYASVNVYLKVIGREDVENPNNIKYTTPVWDIDGSLECWDKIIDITRIIVERIEREGISKSVYLKWSGRGVHVQVHEKSFSEDVLSKYNPLDIAYSVVEYVIKKSSREILEIMKNVKSKGRQLKVENQIDLKRVFTVPLSLHKSLDYAVVCFKPNEIDNFTPEWANPSILRHNTSWRDYIEGEADVLALKAMEEVGGYFKRVGEVRTVLEPVKPKVVKSTSTRRASRVGRFQVMALLQAARYYILTGDIKKAKSFGLNRAIFYAWAKYHGRYRVHRRRLIDMKKNVERVIERGEKLVYVGSEGALVSERGWFKIGDKEQLPEDYDREIARKINSVVPYELAWRSAIEYLKKFPKSILLDQQKFYNEVYKRVRDTFLDDIIKK